MKLFFSGITPEIAKEYYEKSKGINGEKEPEKIDVLVSFYTTLGNTMNTTKAFKEYVDEIMLDSGAFSTFSKPSSERYHIKNRFKMYLKYTINSLSFKKTDTSTPHSLYKIIMSFDEYSTTEKLQENIDIYNELRDIEKAIAPVLHDMNDYENEIRGYYGEQKVRGRKKAKPEFIAIGKLGKEKSPEILNPMIDKIHSFGCKCHVLGVSSFDVLSNCRLDTCDSTSWLKYANYGLINYFSVINGSPYNETVQVQEIENIDKNIKYQKFDEFPYSKDLINDMMNIGIEEKDFRNSKRQKSRMFANIYYTRRMMDYINGCI